jgi:hypothetical protein
MTWRTHDAALLSLMLDAVDVEDQIERTACLSGVAGQCLEKSASNMREA